MTRQRLLAICGSTGPEVAAVCVSTSLCTLRSAWAAVHNPWIRFAERLSTSRISPRLLPIALSALLSACASTPQIAKPSKTGGFEAFNEQEVIYRPGIVSESEEAKLLLTRAKTILLELPCTAAEIVGPSSRSELEKLRMKSEAMIRLESLNSPPDVELRAFRLGSVYPELYSLWIDRRLVYPGSYEQLLELGIAHHRFPVFHVPQSSSN